MSSRSNTASNTLVQRLPRILILCGILLIGSGLAAKGWRLFHLVRSFNDHQTSLIALQEGGLNQIDPATTIELAHDLRKDTLSLKEELTPLLPLAPYLTRMPRIGPLMPVAGNLLNLADDGTLALELLADGLGPALPVLQEGGGSFTEKMPALLAVVESAQPQINAAREALIRVQNEYDTLQQHPTAVAALPFRVRTNLPLVEKLLPVGLDGLALAQVLPHIAGQESPQTYLLVAQNEDELRATGGFITGVALLHIDRGNLGDLEFSDAYAVDNYLAKPYDPPPDPLEYFMGTELFLFRDANYWPDFSTSAEKMMALYTYGQDVPVDGVIAIDQQFLTDLVKLLEPVTVPELSLTMTAANARDALRGSWETGDAEAESWFASRKSFLSPVANALKSSLESRIFSLDPLAMNDFVERSIAQKHLQLFFRDDEIRAVLEKIDWSRPLAGRQNEDTLVVIDTNMGFNKTNAVVGRAITYRVALQPDGSGRGEVTVGYTHGGAPVDEACRHRVPAYTEGTEYDSLIDACYWDFVRVIVPAGSQLLGGSRYPLEEGVLVGGRGWAGEPVVFEDEQDPAGLTTFANFLVIPPGQNKTLAMSYRLPIVTAASEAGGRVYRLHLVKQAGVLPEIVTVEVDLPPGAAAGRITPAPAKQAGGRLTFEFAFDRDQMIEIEFTTKE